MKRKLEIADEPRSVVLRKRTRRAVGIDGLKLWDLPASFVLPPRPPPLVRGLIPPLPPLPPHFLHDESSSPPSSPGEVSSVVLRPRRANVLHHVPRVSERSATEHDDEVRHIWRALVQLYSRFAPWQLVRLHSMQSKYHTLEAAQGLLVALLDKYVSVQNGCVLLLQFQSGFAFPLHCVFAAGCSQVLLSLQHFLARGCRFGSVPCRKSAVPDTFKRRADPLLLQNEWSAGIRHYEEIDSRGGVAICPKSALPAVLRRVGSSSRPTALLLTQKPSELGIRGCPSALVRCTYSVMDSDGLRSEVPVQRWFFNDFSSAWLTLET
eukprot:720716-Amphidinium_carterae.1